MIWDWEHFRERIVISLEDKMSDLAFCKLVYEDPKDKPEDQNDFWRPACNYLLTTFDYGHTCFAWNNRAKRFCIVYPDWKQLRRPV